MLPQKREAWGQKRHSVTPPIPPVFMELEANLFLCARQRKITNSLHRVYFEMREWANQQEHKEEAEQVNKVKRSWNGSLPSLWQMGEAARKHDTLHELQRHTVEAETIFLTPSWHPVRVWEENILLCFPSTLLGFSTSVLQMCRGFPNQESLWLFSRLTGCPTNVTQL